jgi:hypothetical protein
MSTVTAPVCARHVTSPHFNPLQFKSLQFNSQGATA